MLHVDAENSHAAMDGLGSLMLRMSRDQDNGTRQIREPVVLTIDRVQGAQYVCTQEWLNWNPIVGLLEGLWHLSGQTQTTRGMEWLCGYRPAARAEFVFSRADDAFFLPTAYSGAGVDRLASVGAELRASDSDTHHVIATWAWDGLVHPIVTQLLPTIGTSGLDLLVNVAGADLERVPDILLQIGLYHELIAKTAVRRTGALDIVFNRLACSTELFEEIPSYDAQYQREPRTASPYCLDDSGGRLHTLPMSSCGLEPGEILSETRFFIQEGLALGMQWNLIRQVASVFQRVYSTLQDGDAAAQHENACTDVGKMSTGDWQTAALIWLERNSP